MIYAAFSVWLVLIILMGAGVYRLWAGLIQGGWVNWALLPGTVVSEMAYIFGCLITGGEIRRARLMPHGRDSAGRKTGGDGSPAAEATPRLKVLGPIIAALIAIVAVIGAIIAAHSLLGEPVIREFILPDILSPMQAMPRELPQSWDGLWEQIGAQTQMLKHICETWRDVDWSNWRVPLFVYLSMCLAVRLAPVGRDMRATLAAVVVIAAMVALIGAIWEKFSGLMDDIWPLLTYIYALLLFLLMATLVIYGCVGLFRVLSGKKAQ